MGYLSSVERETEKLATWQEQRTIIALKDRKQWHQPGFIIIRGSQGRQIHSDISRFVEKCPKGVYPIEVNHSTHRSNLKAPTPE